MPFSPMENLLQGRKGLILGLANEHSIAYGCAQLARQQGAEIVATCVNERAYEFVEPLANSMDIPLLVCDVEKEDDLQQAVESAATRLGKIDFVVHSIAWAPLEDLHAQVVDSSPEGFARAMSVSCHSFARLGKLCAPYMAKGGSLVTMSYLGSEAVIPHYGLMGPVKAALESLVRYMAAELGPQGIRVHAVSPGPIPTRAASGIEEFGQLMANAQQKSPLNRLVTLEEIAALCGFLCSDLSSAMTGQTIFVDAGFHVVA